MKCALQCHPRLQTSSHSTRVRGLKWHTFVIFGVIHKVALYTSAWIEISSVNPTYHSSLASHSTRVRGLKCWFLCQVIQRNKSHSTRVRGLKSIILKVIFQSVLSHSTRVRGLKSKYTEWITDQMRVALYTSAWIEIVGWYLP